MNVVLKVIDGFSGEVNEANFKASASAANAIVEARKTRMVREATTAVAIALNDCSDSHNETSGLYCYESEVVIGHMLFTNKQVKIGFVARCDSVDIAGWISFSV